MRFGRAAIVMAAIVYSSTAHAQEEPPNWGIDVGVGSTFGAAGVGAIGGIGGVAGLPIFSATVERRLGDRLWAMMRGGASYQGNTAGGEVSRSWAVDGSLGIRHALTAPEPLEVSWYGALKAGYARQDVPGGLLAGDPADFASMRAWTAGLQLGLSLDKQLTEWFGLRLRIDMAELGYQRATISTTTDSPPTESWYAQLKLAPSFAVRFTF